MEHIVFKYLMEHLYLSIM